MTTSEPQIAQKIFETAKSMGIESLDAPVSGGDVGAKNATLSVSFFCWVMKNRSWLVEMNRLFN
jgi:hypothetical protein